MHLPLRLRALVVLLAGALVPATSAAQTNDFYASLSGLHVMTTDSDVSYRSEVGPVVSTNLSTESGLGFLAAVGYGPDVGLRGEVEFGYRSADFDRVDGLTITVGDVSASHSVQFPFDGEVTTLSLMTNGIYVFEHAFDDTWKLRPYVGAGLGLARHDVSHSDLTLSAVNVGGFTLEAGSDDDIVIAYQVLAGVGLPISAISESAESEGAEIRLGYRYFATGDNNFGRIRASYGTHNIEAGVLFRF